MTEHFLAPTRQLTSQAWERTASMPALLAPRPLRTLLTVPLLAFAILAAASAFAPATDASAATATSKPSSARQQKVLRAASVARRQIGDPYRYGAAGPGSFDCSGLMKYSSQKAGSKLPRTAAAQSK